MKFKKMLRDEISKGKNGESPLNIAVSDIRRTSDSLMRRLKFDNLAIVAEIHHKTDFKINS